MMTSRVVGLVASLLLVVVVSGDCPPRTPEQWEHSSRPDALRGYTKDVRCPQVQITLSPERIFVAKDITVATMDVGVHLDWIDPGLVRADTAEEGVRFNSSEIWTPQFVTSFGFRTLSPQSVTSQSIEAELGRGSVRSFYRTTLGGMCFPETPDLWPRDSLRCQFAIHAASPVEFSLTQVLSVSQHDELRKKLGFDSSTDGLLSSWKVTKFSSIVFHKFNTSSMLVHISLQRLPAQLEAEVVHPMCLVSALAPASAALPPWSEERPVLIATGFLVHTMLLLFLPYLDVAADGHSLPRNLLLYRDGGLLLLLVLLQWLLSLRLASRRKPLVGWLRSGARALAHLRTPLLLPTVPAVPPTPARPQGPRRGLDEESVGLSEVLDRLTLLTVAAAYLAFVVSSLQ